MVMYRLPTRATRKYRGKYPSNVYSVSLTAVDVDGNRCAHFETNCGERFTVSYDRLNTIAVNAAKSFCGKCITQFIRDNTVIEPLSRERYDAWLDNTHRFMRTIKEAGG